MNTLPVIALALILGLAPVAAPAKIISMPPVTPSDPADSLPSPTVLRGSPPNPPKPVPICPPGYVASADYGCIAPAGAEYAEGWPSYDYWPDYGYPGYGYSFFGHRVGRLSRFHAFQAFHRPARFGGIGIGHMAGFARR